jgi:hypothetical protein
VEMIIPPRDRHRPCDDRHRSDPSAPRPARASESAATVALPLGTVHVLKCKLPDRLLRLVRRGNGSRWLVHACSHARCTAAVRQDGCRG